MNNDKEIKYEELEMTVNNPKVNIRETLLNIIKYKNIFIF